MNDVEKKISESSSAFETLVWPVIAESCGGGEIETVEAATGGRVDKVLDMQAGIDVLQGVVVGGHIKLRGISSRVQPGYKSWDTFTIRYKLRSGHATEWDKLKWATNNEDRGWLFPYLCVHAYVTNEPDPANRRLLGVGVVKTRDLVKHVERYLPKAMEEQALFPSGVYIKTNGEDGTQFIVASWQKLKEDGVEVKTVNPITKETP